MNYWHEEQERKPNVKPMCTELPSRCVDVTIGMRACDYMTDRKLSRTVALANGWYVSTTAGDRFPRIVIPAITHKVGHVYWQARDITGKAYIRYQSPEGPRHEALIKVMPCRKNPLGIVVVEGPMDALAAAGCGYIGYALMGMQPNNATLMHLALLIEDNSKLKTLVLLDRGEMVNGIKVSMFLCSQGYSAKIAELPEKDLAACLPATRSKFLSQKFLSLFKSKS